MFNFIVLLALLCIALVVYYVRVLLRESRYEKQQIKLLKHMIEALRISILCADKYLDRQRKTPVGNRAIVAIQTNCHSCIDMLYSILEAEYGQQNEREGEDE